MAIPGVQTHRLLNCVDVALLRETCRLRAFVETGILDGDGIAVALHYGFGDVYSCDIDPVSVEKAKRRFPNANVHLTLGDSREFIEKMAGQISVPTLFWLDAHFPDHAAGEVGEYPLPGELAVLGKRPGIGKDVILCDDMRVIPGDDNPTLIPDDHPDIAMSPDRFIQRHLTLRKLWEPFVKTHDAYLIHEEMGVLMLLPKGTPYQSPIRWRWLRRARILSLRT